MLQSVCVCRGAIVMIIIIITTIREQEIKKNLKKRTRNGLEGDGLNDVAFTGHSLAVVVALLVTTCV